MAYGLKYSQYITKGGATIQIRVYVKDYSGASYGMAHLTGASLQIIGGQSDPLTPIIKTALSWSLADCWDEGTTQADGTECVNAQGEKCGRWEEFYTPDATKFRVELWAAQTAAATPACIWTGYITPDSWSENMIYRGSITLTARDMLGALQEKEFNLTGRVSVLDIVQGALSACACPMALSYTAGHFLVNSNGQSILAHTIAASTFSGDNWQTALEDTLESLGLVLRYNGANGLVLAPLRYVREDTLSGTHTIEFTGRSGLRELVPALREITETFDLEIVNIPASDPDESQYAATGDNLTQVVVAHTPSGTFTNTHYIPGYTLTESGGEGWSGGLATPAPGTPIEGIPERKMWFPTDVTDAVQAVWNNPRLRGSYAVKIEQDGPVAWWTGSAPNTHLAPFYGNNTIKEIEMQVVAVVNGTTKYLSPSGSWDTAENTIHYAIGSEINVPDCGAVGAKIIIKKVVTECTYPASRALFVALNLSVQPATEGSTIISEYKTTTEYDEKNNVTITRSPKVGSATLSGCVDFYENVLAYGDAIAPDEWNWPGQSSYYPLAVMIQAQVLCYHAAAASVFTGTAHDKTLAGAFALPGCAYEYYQRGCIPLSATFDFVSGFVGQMNIREVYSWADVWGASFEPQYTQRSGAGRGSTSATGTGGSAVSPGGGGGGGSFPGGVNYFELDDTLVRLKGQYAYLGPRKGLIFDANAEADVNADFEKVALPGGGYALHSKLPFCSDSFISAGWLSSGGGAAAGNATLVAQTYGGTLSATGIEGINFYSKERVDQLLLTAGKVQTVAGVSPTSGDIPVASLKSALGLGAAAEYGIGSVASGNTGLVTGGSVYSAINEAVSSVMKMQGTTTTPISDGSTTNPIVIDGESYTAKKGDVVLYDGKEYLWAGSAWEQLGDEASWALKTTTISAGTGLEGGGTLASNRTISINSTYQTYISNGNKAYGWGDWRTRVGTLETNLTAITTRVTTLEGRTNWDNYFGIDSDGNVYVKKDGDNPRHFYSYGAVSAGGLSTGGGTGGIDLAAMWASLQNNDIGTSGPAYEHRHDKIHTWHLPACGTGLSYTTDSAGLATGINVSFPVSSVSKGNATSGGAVTTSSGAVTIQFPDSLPASDVYSWAKQASKPSYSFSEITGTASTSQIPDLSGTYQPVGNYAVRQTSNDFVFGGNEVTIIPGGYTGDLYINYRTTGGYNGGLTAYRFYSGDSSHNLAGIVASYFGVGGGSSSQFLKADGSLDNTAYLPLTGGALEAATGNFFNLNATSGANCWQYFRVGGTEKASVGYYAGLAFVANEVGGYARIGVNDSGTPQYWSSNSSSTAQTLLHTGNFVAGTNYVAPSALDSYLPLSAGSGKALTGDLFFGTRSNSIGAIGDAYLSFESNGNEMCFAGSDDFTLHVNYRKSRNNHAPTTWLWNAGTPKSYASFILGSVSASSIAVRGGTSAMFLKADGSLDNTGYLPLTGGVLSLSSGSDLIIRRITNNSSEAIVRYEGQISGSNAVLGYLGFDGVNTPAFVNNTNTVAYSLYHSGNCNKSDVDWLCQNLSATNIYGKGNFQSDAAYYGFSVESVFGPWYGVKSYYTWDAGQDMGIARIATSHNIGGLAIGFARTSYSFSIPSSANYTDRIYIKENGNVGVNNAYPAYELDVTGVIHATTGILSDGYVTAGSASSREFKDDVQNMSLEYARNIIMSSRPITFQWNALAHSLCDKYEGDGIGFIAQEAEQLMPFAVSPIFEKYKRLDYTAYISPLVRVAQSHETRIQQLERENAELKRRLNMN